MTTKKDIVYKICTQAEWQELQNTKSFKGSSDDLRDGFIHLSSQDQVSGTLKKHFKGQKNLLLISVDVGLLPHGQLKWEKSRNNEKFPHLYGDLNLDAVINIAEIPE